MSSTRRLLLCSGQGTAPAKPVCGASRRGDTGRSQASHLRVQAEAGPSPAVRHWRGRAQPRHPGATSRPEARANTPSPRAGSLRLHRAEGSGPATSGTERPGASPGPPRELAQCSDPEKEELTSPTPPSWTVACWTLRSAPGMRVLVPVPGRALASGTELGCLQRRAAEGGAVPLLRAITAVAPWVGGLGLASS